MHSLRPCVWDSPPCQPKNVLHSAFFTQSHSLFGSAPFFISLSPIFLSFVSPPLSVSPLCILSLSLSPFLSLPPSVSPSPSFVSLSLPLSLILRLFLSLSLPLSLILRLFLSLSALKCLCALTPLQWELTYLLRNNVHNTPASFSLHLLNVDHGW